MSSTYLDDGKKKWEEEYRNGYGNQWPDTKMITAYYRYIKPHVISEKPKVLDFGCGIGQNLRFFETIGFEVYGIDISKKAIERCLELHPHWKERVCSANILKEKTISELFDVNFDVVISCECLYYLNDVDITYVLEQFSNCMTSNGRFYGTMHSWASNNFKSYKKCKETSALTAIDKFGRLDTSFAMNIIENEKELQEKFSVLECEHIFKSSSNITGVYSESFHYIGRKR